VDPLITTTPQWWRSIEGAARDVGIDPQEVLVRSEAEIDTAIDAIAQTPKGAIIVAPQAIFIFHRARFIELSKRNRLPAVYDSAIFVSDGGLCSYGPDIPDQYVRAAGYIDRILKGEKPGDLPVQFPTKYELAVNLKTTRPLAFPFDAGSGRRFQGVLPHLGAVSSSGTITSAEVSAPDKDRIA
jgi:putative tryptophan/tyrosine transport system substrate-binding protein